MGWGKSDPIKYGGENVTGTPEKGLKTNILLWYFSHTNTTNRFGYFRFKNI